MQDIDVAEQLVEEGVAEWSVEVTMATTMTIINLSLSRQQRPWGDGQDSPEPKVSSACVGVT